MKTKTMRKNGTYGVLAFGVKNPEVDMLANLKALSIEPESHCYSPRLGYTRFCLENTSNEKYMIDVADILEDKLKLLGVVGFGVGNNPEQIETELRDLMRCSGVLAFGDDDLFSEEHIGRLTNELEKLVTEHSCGRRDEQ